MISDIYMVRPYGKEGASIKMLVFFCLGMQQEGEVCTVSLTVNCVNVRGFLVVLWIHIFSLFFQH